VFEIAKDGTVLHLRDFEEDEALVAQQAQVCGFFCFATALM